MLPQPKPQKKLEIGLFQFKTDFDEEIEASWFTRISDFFGFGDGECSGGAVKDYDPKYFDPDEVEFSNFDEALPA